MAMKRCLEDDEIERQLKCKICDVGLLLSRVLQGLLQKGKIQLHDAGVKACIYVEQVTKKNVRLLNFSIYENKYEGLCVCFY
jgi:hypothetical protein